MLPEGFHIEEFRCGSAHIYLARHTPFPPLQYIDLLTVNEAERLQTFGHPQRKMEFAATRILRHQLFGTSHIHYDAFGAPFIENEGFISISHCQGAVALALCPDYKIGLDLEKTRPNIAELAHKFLSESEKTEFDVHSVQELTKIWSAKEALYKLAGRKKIHFKSELLLHKDPAEDWMGTIINPEKIISAKLNIFEPGDLFITINATAIVEKAKNS